MLSTYLRGIKCVFQHCVKFRILFDVSPAAEVNEIGSSRSSSLPYRAQRVLSYSMSAAARAFQGNSDKTDRVVGAVV